MGPGSRPGRRQCLPRALSPSRGGAPRSSPKIVSNITLNYPPKLARKPPVARANDDAVASIGRRRCYPSSPADVRRSPQFIGRRSMSKRIAFLTAAALGALALTATIVAPVSAEEKTVMVGGAAMFPSKNIIQNAVNSKDHTTLVAAVKAAGLVETLQGPGPFTVFAPTNAASAKLPPGTVDSCRTRGDCRFRCPSRQ